MGFGVGIAGVGGVSACVARGLHLGRGRSPDRQSGDDRAARSADDLVVVGGLAVLSANADELLDSTAVLGGKTPARPSCHCFTSYAEWAPGFFFFFPPSGGGGALLRAALGGGPR